MHSYAAEAIPSTNPNSVVTTNRWSGLIGGRLNSAVFAAAVLLFVGSFALRLAALHVVLFDWDEYAFALSGRAVLHGHLPSTQIFDNKPAGLVYAFAASEAVFGETVTAIRALGLAASLAVGLILVLCARRLRLPWAAGLALAAIFQIDALACDGWATMSELLACPFLAAAYWISLRRGDLSFLRLGCVGALMGAAVQTSYLTMPIAGLVAAGMIAGQSIERCRLQSAAAFAGGFAAAVFIIWLPQIIAGQLGSFLHEQVSYQASYRIGSHGFWSRVAPPLGSLWPSLLLTAGILALGWPNLAGARRSIAVIGSSLVGALIGAFASNRFYAHYFLLLLPSLAFLMLIALACADDKRRGIGVAIILAVSATAIVSDANGLRTQLSGKVDPRTPTVSLAGSGGTDFEAQFAAMARRLSPRGQSIYVFNETPVAYYLAQREPASRYVFLTHYLPDPNGGSVTIQPDCLMAQVLSRRPAVVFIGHLLPTGFRPEATLAQAGYRPAATLVVGDRRVSAFTVINTPPSTASSEPLDPAHAGNIKGPVGGSNASNDPTFIAMHHET